MAICSTHCYCSAFLSAAHMGVECHGMTLNITFTSCCQCVSSLWVRMSATLLGDDKHSSGQGGNVVGEVLVTNDSSNNLQRKALVAGSGSRSSTLDMEP